MFGLLRRARTSHSIRPARSFRTILQLDGLECRDQPSDFGVGGEGRDGRIAPENLPPQITTFTITRVGEGLYLIEGVVVDENPGGLTITLGGSTSAAGETTTTWSNGTFSMVVILQTDGTDVGFITATTIDDHNQKSNEVSVYVTPT